MSAICKVRSAMMIANRASAIAVRYLGENAVLPKNRALAATVFALCLLALPQSASSHGGIRQDSWNPAHLTNLPPEIRDQAKKWEAACGAPIAATQQFALYLTTLGTQFVALHFDDFQCRNRGVICKASGCLYEVYVAARGRYRKVLALRAQDVRLVRERNAAFLEVQDRSSGAPRILRWNGSRFVTQAGA
ncbi:hypothetical protein ABIF65_007871 [Bradyrhizobium japonicum]|nr:hypothetical protein [Bradyrhizobium japonicum]MCP1863817.1 hypothetical protein [Bradyrhizobium japonicum]MCP1963446.1 hypothetical protein [Bradyrhizobium japonicum]MCW2327788.1 hypothetical protein [Bradyrhizobium japonicum]